MWYKSDRPSGYREHDDTMIDLPPQFASRSPPFSSSRPVQHGVRGGLQSPLHVMACSARQFACFSCGVVTPSSQHMEDHQLSVRHTERVTWLQVITQPGPHPALLMQPVLPCMPACGIREFFLPGYVMVAGMTCPLW